MSASPPPSVHNLFQDYVAPMGVYDEVLTPEQTVRPHLQPLVEGLNRLGGDEFSRRWQQARRLVHENGLAYSGHATPRDKPRPWELDAVPLVIGSSEWKEVSAGVRQRARLLNLALQDLYGEQRLLAEGVLPVELVFSHPGFFRACHGQRPPQDLMLPFYSADLARGPDGRWMVLADRTEAPSGAGYALENRVVISRMLPELFRQCQVERLAPFFIALQDTLRNLAPFHRENPHVVLLSHGPTSPNYFEDAYLARYLGYTLVQGGDLTVRGGRVLLKTLGGLLPVDIVLRRQNGDDCDPLELGSTTGIGVSGLIQSVRSGNVAVANPLGGGLIESPAFLAFMPQLCRFLLSEDLRLPTAPTWWCGDAESREHVLANLDQMVIHPAFRRRGRDGPLRERLASMSAQELAETIRSEPKRFVAQQSVLRSSAPVWPPDQRPAHVAMRSFAVASDGAYLTMQGALARVSSSVEPLEMSIRRGELSKDVWVLAEGPVEHVSLLDEPGRAVELRRSGADLPSRVADNIFWLGRQMERGEAAARLIRSTVRRLTGESTPGECPEIPLLLRCLADQGQIEPGYAVDEMRSQLTPIEQVLPRSVFDPQQPGCLRSVLDNLFRLGSIVRDRMSLDTWRIIRLIDEGFQPSGNAGASSAASLVDLVPLTDEVIVLLSAFSGMVMESMTRAQAYRFLDIGRRLERSLQIVSLIKNCFSPPPEVQGPVCETVLEISDSLMTYRSRYMAHLQLGATLDLLLVDETNPRSLAYQLVQLDEHVDRLPRVRDLAGQTPERRLTMSMLHTIRMADVPAIAHSHNLGDERPLLRLARELQSQLPRLSETISHRYLVHAGESHQLASIRPRSAKNPLSASDLSQPRDST